MSDQVDEYAEETDAAMNYGQGYFTAREDLRKRIETLDHDYMLHVHELSDADQWTDDQMQTYAATVAGVLRLLDEPMP